MVRGGSQQCASLPPEEPGGSPGTPSLRTRATVWPRAGSRHVTGVVRPPFPFPPPGGKPPESGRGTNAAGATHAPRLSPLFSRRACPPMCVTTRRSVESRTPFRIKFQMEVQPQNSGASRVTWRWVWMTVLALSVLFGVGWGAWVWNDFAETRELYHRNYLGKTPVGPQWIQKLLGDAWSNRFFRIDGGKIGAGWTDHDLRVLSRQPAVTDLDIYASGYLTDDRLRILELIRSLHSLSLVGNQNQDITDRSIPWIVSQSGLVDLEIAGCGITASSLSRLVVLRHLKRLGIDVSLVNESSAASLSRMPRLAWVLVFKPQDKTFDAGSELVRVMTKAGFEFQGNAGF